MSLEIGGLGAIQPSEVPQVQAARGTGDFAAVLSEAQQDPGVQVDVEPSFPDTPPPEVTRAIHVASRAYEQLSATGQQLHFRVQRPSGGLAVELQDLDGNPLSTISASEALRIAGGESLN